MARHPPAANMEPNWKRFKSLFRFERLSRDNLQRKVAIWRHFTCLVDLLWVGSSVVTECYMKVLQHFAISGSDLKAYAMANIELRIEKHELTNGWQRLFALMPMNWWGVNWSAAQRQRLNFLWYHTVTQSYLKISHCDRISSYLTIKNSIKNTTEKV